MDLMTVKEAAQQKQTCKIAWQNNITIWNADTTIKRNV
jgi:hypothetical protein